MAISSGIGARFLVAEFNPGASAAAMRRMAMLNGQQNITNVQQSAMARNGLKRDGALDVGLLFDDAAGQSHPVFSALPTASRLISYLHRATRGAPAWVLNAKQVTYTPNLGQDGSLTMEAATVADQYGLELGHTLTAGVETSTGAESLAGVDDQETATTTNFGLQAFLHVIAFTGTSATITIQDSDDDGSVDPYAAVTGGAFTAVTGATSERIATGRTQAIKRWMRINIAGTYSDLQFAVAVVRNEVAVDF